jgi:hypothetical protein
VAADVERGPPLPARRRRHLALVGRTLHYVRASSTATHDRRALDARRRRRTTWEPRAPLPRARGLASAVVAGRLYAIGGQIRHDTDPVDLAAVDVYDPSAMRDGGR